MPLRTLTVTPEMLSTIGSTFYPTGYALVMFPQEAMARDVGARLSQAGWAGADALYIVPPTVVLRDILRTADDADSPLPSAGSEAATARGFGALAREGHWGLLVAVEDNGARDRLLAALLGTGYSHAQRYRRLVIEDL